jgi:hypothetical protein
MSQLPLAWVDWYKAQQLFARSGTSQPPNESACGAARRPRGRAGYAGFHRRQCPPARVHRPP